MEYEEFLGQIRQTIQDRSAEGVRVQIRHIIRNNQNYADGLVITGDGGNAVPVIYLEEFYQQYQEGTPFERIIERVLRLHHRYRPNMPVDMSFYRDFEQVRGRILCRLVNFEQNRQTLRNMPHHVFFDLAVIYSYRLEEDVLSGRRFLRASE